MKKHFEGPVATIDSSSRLEGRELLGSGGYGEDVYASGLKGALYLAEHSCSIKHVLQYILRDYKVCNQPINIHTIK
jgi:hypothetical protein